MKKKIFRACFTAIILCLSFVFSSTGIYGMETAYELSEKLEGVETYEGALLEVSKEDYGGSEDEPEEEETGETEPIEEPEEESPDEEPIQLPAEEISQNILPARLDLNNIYENPIGNFEDLLETIKNAPEEEETVITVVDDIEVMETITIKEGQNIVLINDESERSIRRGSDVNFSIFSIEHGGILTVRENTGGSFIFDSGGMGASNPGKHSGVIIECRGTFNLEGGILTGSKVAHGYSGVVYATGEVGLEPAVFNMRGGEISDNILATQQCSAVVIYGNVKFNMSGGKIKNNKVTEDVYVGALVECDAGGVSLFSRDNKGPASFYMSGGEISGNHASQGGVSLYSYGGRITDSTSFTMNGGSITGNSASYAGGGVFVLGNSRFTMERGSITGNEAVEFGGGVGTFDAYSRGSIEEHAKLYPAAFIMNGGIIDGNKAVSATGFGGGIYVASHTVEINKGEIINNYAGKEGGGIYVGNTPHILNISNAVITDNYAKEDGGGIWLCPTGSLETKVTGGMALYANKAGRAGEDLASEAKSGEFFNLLSERMLGGGAVLWYSDNAGERYGSGSEDSQPIKLDKVVTEDCYAAAEVSQEAVNAALANYTVLISGNEAGRCGGGIGTNGGVEIGRDGVLSIEIFKEWEIPGQTEVLREADIPGPIEIVVPEEIQIYLWINGEIHPEEYFLSKENQWYLKIENLPDTVLSTDRISDYYKITEAPVNGFKSRIEQMYNEDANIFKVSIVNFKDKPSSQPNPPQSNPADEVENDRERPEKEWPENEKKEPEEIIPNTVIEEDIPKENKDDSTEYEQTMPDKETLPIEERMEEESAEEITEEIKEEIQENNFVKENPKTSDPLSNAGYWFFIWISLLAAIFILPKRTDEIL